MKVTTFIDKLLLLELPGLVVMLGAFWFPSPVRDPWLRLLILIPLMMLARWFRYRRLYTRFPLDILMGMFIILCVVNVYAAPYTRGLLMLGRPLLGIALCIYAVEYARLHRKLDGLLIGALGLMALIGLMAITSTQWNSKSDQLRFMIDTLPQIRIFPGAEGGFNANEMAGALTYVIPLCSALMVHYWQKGSRWRVGYGIAFGLCFLSLFLAQSRLGIFSTLLMLALLTPLLVRPGWRRNLIWSILALVTVFEILVIQNVFAPANLSQRIERDSLSLEARLQIWQSALHIIRDYPVTGVGMNMFRDGRVREAYPVPIYEQSILPHTHNEILQITTDLGLPGLAFLISIYLVVAWMLVHVYRNGDHMARSIAAGIGLSLLGHAIFGLGDAIPLWDRFAFLWWGLLALACAQYILQKLNPAASQGAP